MGSMQTTARPRQEPDQPLNRQPFEGVAVRRSGS
jgi:hypothetical protein